MPTTVRSMGLAVAGALLCAAGLLLGGCGQKGPLYLTPAHSAAAAPASTTATPSVPAGSSSTR